MDCWLRRFSVIFTVLCNRKIAKHLYKVIDLGKNNLLLLIIPRYETDLG